MRPIPLGKHHYLLSSTPLAAQRLVNMYAEQTPPEATRAKGGFHLLRPPGSKAWATAGSGPIRGAKLFDDYLYVVSAGSLYRVDSDANATLMGAIGGSGRVYMESNGQQLMIVGGTSGYYVQSGTLNSIADVDFEGATSLAFLGGFMVVVVPDSQKFMWSDSYDVSSWQALNFASAEGSPDKALSVIANNQLLWFLGEESCESFYLSGQTASPFTKQQGVYMERGILAPASLAPLDESFIWLGSDKMVYRAVNGKPQRISTHAIETAIQGYSTVTDAWATTYFWKGHLFYVLTFPTAGVTWSFDAATQLWHERQTGVGPDVTRWRYNVCTTAFGKMLAGDSLSGAIDEMSEDFTEAGDPVERQFTLPELDNNRAAFNCYGIELDLETGVGLSSGQGSDPIIMHDWSKDGGKTWSDEREMRIGALGEYTYRARSRRLGKSRNLLNRFRLTDPVGLDVYGAYAELEPLSH